MNPYSKENYNRIYTYKYKQHYKELRFYPVWNYIANISTTPIIELGCGCGHFAQMLYDKGINEYTGYDFSDVGIKECKKRVPSFKFVEKDVYNINLNEKATYVAIEVLEHLKDDKTIISLLPKGSRFIFSVPNYKAPNHYRIYPDKEFIKAYYKDILKIIDIKVFPQNHIDNIYVVNSVV
jgi:trans-aconitate methyltransferase